MSGTSDRRATTRCAADRSPRDVERIASRALRRDALLEVDPDALVLAAIVGAADAGAVLVDGAAVGLGVVVDAVAVLAAADLIRAAVVPADDALLEALLR